MKYIYLIFFFLVSTMGVVQGQKNDDPLIGKWENTYGSVLTINWHNVDGFFSGIYSSSTGASGKYLMVGFSPSVSPTQDVNSPQPLSFTLLWRPTESPKGTVDEEWTSSMLGQITLNQSGQWIMEVFHSLNASTPLIAVEIDAPGRYAETLTFIRTSTTPDKVSLSKASMVDKLENIRLQQNSVPPVFLQNPLKGNWVGEFSTIYSALDLPMIDDASSLQPGLIAGTIIQNGNTIPVLGFTLPDVPTGSVQSFSLAFMKNDEHGTACYAVNGFLHNTNRIEATISKSRVAPYTSKYTAVQIIDKAIFYRNTATSAINIPLHRNPFTNNGSSEWTANLSVGEAAPYAPILKFGIDTGGNFLWANSTQCPTKSCTGFGHTQFDPNTSPSFHWIDKTSKKINWGPWGSAMGNTGTDYISINTNYTALAYNMKLITHFDETAQFDEFLWDGAIALPANASQMEPPTSSMVKNLVDNGQLVPKNGKVCVAFYYHPEAKYGLVTIGNWDSTLVDMGSKLTFKYQAYAPVPYLWCSPLTSFSIGDQQIASGGSYSFDTGSSALKGDAQHMQQAFDYATTIFQQTGNYPLMSFKMGVDNHGNTGTLVLTPDQYVQLIEEGEHTGEHIPQIQTLKGTPNLYLQGSTMLGYVYSVFWWNATPTTNGSYNLTAKEVWLFNKIDGPKIIQDQAVATLPSVKEKNLRGIAYPNPVQKTLYVAFTLQNLSNVVLMVHSPTGTPLYKKHYYGLPQGNHTLTVEKLDWNTSNSLQPFVIVSVVKGQEVILKETILTEQNLKREPEYHLFMNYNLNHH